MGSTLATFRQDVADALTAAGLSAFAHVPERVVPPVAIVLPDQPYVAAGEGEDTTMCGTFRVRARINVLGGKGTNERCAADLDELIVRTLLAVDGLFDGLEVAEPAEVELNGAGYLGTVITLTDVREMETTP